jgi:membrane protease YdiL (CAAX protease family)
LARLGRFGELIRPAFVDRVERDHLQSDRAFLVRRIVVAVTLVVGGTLLSVSLNVPPNDPSFYPLTIGLAAAWLVGGFVSGPLHLGYVDRRGTLRRPVITPIVVGVVLAVVFIVGALIVREIPPLASTTDAILEQARYRPIVAVAAVTALNGIAEEVFFRGALFAAIGRKYPVTISTAVYGLVTIATGNAMLVLAAFLLGAILGLQRRASGGILGPILTHITWSLTMLLVLPPLFSAVG